MQIANNKHVEDFWISGGTVMPDFSGKVLELKYSLSDEAEVNEFLGNKNSTHTEVKQAKHKLNFSKIICRFFFSNYVPSLELQKQLILLQKDIFDEVTVQMVKDNFDDLKTLYGYALNNTEKPLSTLIDPKLSPSLLLQVVEYLGTVRPVNTRWVYHKLSSHIDRFRIVSNTMQELGIDAYVTNCRKRYAGDTEFKNMDVSTILKGYFKFKGCALDCNSKNNKEGKKKGFAPDMDLFDEKTYEWIKVKNEDYRGNRLRDFVKLDGINPNKEELDKRDKVKRLYQRLEKLGAES